MIGARRGFTLLSFGLVAFCGTLVYLYSTRASAEWRKVSQVPGIGELLDAADGWRHNYTSSDGSVTIVDESRETSFPTPPDSTYTRHLVVAKMKDEEADWLFSEDLNGALPQVYVPDDPSAPLTVPENKGHEAMVYLTYIIDHYDELPDVAVFMHAHKKSWHQAGLLEHDGAETVRRLSSARVIREGYMNLRCEWAPGCPKWLHPTAVDPNTERIEEPLIPQVWTELFPGVALPDNLAQPCCAQFALSRENIRNTPREDFVLYRDWLLRTSLADEVTGRIFEYLWQFIFTRNAVFCPDMYACYCDGFGVCFKNAKDFDYWFELRWEKHLKEEKLQEWRSRASGLEEYRHEGELTGVEGVELEIPTPGIDIVLSTEIEQLATIMEEGRQKAIERGKNPAFRAKTAGRNWTEGDGF